LKDTLIADGDNDLVSRKMLNDALFKGDNTQIGGEISEEKISSIVIGKGSIVNGNNSIVIVGVIINNQV
jgi:hypothetical protein